MQELKLIGKECPIPRAGCNFLQYEKGKYLVIGGVNRSENGLKELNDFWTLYLPLTDTNLAGIWKELKLENQEIYTPRSSQAACLTNNQLIYIFGGQKFLESQSTDEFFCIDPNKKILKIIKSQNTPKGRNSHTLTYGNGKLYLFGGADEKGPLSDFHIFDIQTEIWQQVEDVADLIMAREMHTSHILSLKLEQKHTKYDGKQKIITVFEELNLSDPQNEPQILQKNDQILDFQEEQNQQQQQVFQESQNITDYLIVIGGRHKNELLKDVSAINLITHEVVQIDNLKTGLCAHTSVAVNEDIYIFGGFDGTQLNQNIYQLSNQKVLKSGTLQTAIMASSALYSNEINKIVIFGGCTLDRDLNQTYIVKI